MQREHPRVHLRRDLSGVYRTHPSVSGSGGSAVPLRLLGRPLSEWRAAWQELETRVLSVEYPARRNARALLVIATAANLGLSPAALEPVGSLRQWAHRKLGWRLQPVEKHGGPGPTAEGKARRAAQFTGEPVAPLAQNYPSYQRRQETRRERRERERTNSNRG